MCLRECHREAQFFKFFGTNIERAAVQISLAQVLGELFESKRAITKLAWQKE